MNIVWVSANKMGYEIFKEAVKSKSINIRAIITLATTSKTVMYDGIENTKWHEFGVDVFEIDDINNEGALLKRLSPDLIIMCGWRQMVKKHILSIPRKGVIAFHPALLPYGRGPAPIINSLMTGLKKSGLTMFYVSEGLDNGDIIAQEEFIISENDDAASVYRKVIRVGKKMIREYLPRIAKGKAPRITQDNSKVVFFNKPFLANNKIELEKESLEEAFRKIKALAKPYRGAYIEKGKKRLIIWKAELQDIK